MFNVQPGRQLAAVVPGAGGALADLGDVLQNYADTLQCQAARAVAWVLATVGGRCRVASHFVLNTGDKDHVLAQINLHKMGQTKRSSW